MNKQLNRFLFTGALAAVIALCLTFSLGYLPRSRTGAQSSTPSAKSAMQAGNIAVVDGRLGAGSSQTSWQNIMFTTIKTSQQKDLVMTASLEVGLYTRTLVRSKSGTPDTSSAGVGVEVRLMVDEGTPNQRIAEPGDVVFGRRLQELTATFQGLIDGCLTVDPLTGSVIINETCVKPEELQLILDTMNANSFTFALDDLGAGVHSVKMQTRIKLNNTVQTGEVEARATIGKGCLSVEEVRFVKGADITL
ncbi:MAG: hypothetical protein ACREEM_38750 [Blastocatellia bacterium]